MEVFDLIREKNPMIGGGPNIGVFSEPHLVRKVYMRYTGVFSL